MKVTGTVEKKGFGFGVWALVANDGTTYQLHEPATELQKSGIKVEIVGEIRTDIMTTAMIGDVLAIESYQLL